MSLLVTGATSHLGLHLVRRLLEEGQKVRCFVRNTSDRGPLQGLQVEWAMGDVMNVTFLIQAMEGVSCLFSLTPIKFAPLILEACQREGLKRVIFMSSTRRFTNFPCRSSQEVIEAERLIEGSGLHYTILRPTMIYGDERDKNMTRLIFFIARFGFFPILGNGRSKFQPVWVEDLVEAIIRAWRDEKTIGKAYNLAGKAPITLEELVQATGRAMGKRVILFHLPMTVAKAGVFLYERVAKKPRVTLEQIKRLQEDKAYDTTLAQEELGFYPLSFQEGIKLKVEQLRSKTLL